MANDEIIAQLQESLKNFQDKVLGANIAGSDKGDGKLKPPLALIILRSSTKQVPAKCKGKENVDVTRVKKSKSRELRGGNLYCGCLCERRNGLQDDCPRSDCMGSPACLTKPPTCGPSEFADAKHLYKRLADKNRFKC